MADSTASAPPTGIAAGVSSDDAEAACERFMALSRELRGCAILSPGGLLAATGDREAWLEPAAGMLDAADRAAGGRASQAHVATEDGEAYAARMGLFAMVAVTDRFTLASLVLADMRAALRELIAAPAPSARKAA